MNYRIITYLCTTLVLLISINTTAASGYADIIVDQNGSRDYKTITAAIEALPMFAYQRTVILVRNGIYEEKLRLNQNYLTLRGENPDSTIVRFSILRSDWDKDKDHLGPAVINIYGDDIVLDNLTIENTQPEIGPHAFAIYSKGTRTIITNCNVISKGGDTVSLWNYKEGMYYHADCYFEGAVDFVCPRGWCFIRDSKFYEVKQTAALWHDGHYDPDQKFVIINSDFDGVEGFSLGRHHYEAQFYLLDCRFAANMGDRPIYFHTYDDPAKNNPYYHGDRNYFYHCTKAGTAYAWYADNLSKAPGSPSPEKITPAWTFNDRWDPESQSPLTITGCTIDGKSLILTFSEIVSVRGEPAFQNHSGKVFRIVKQRFNDTNKLLFVAEAEITKEDLSGELVLQKGDIIASVAGIYERSIGSLFSIESQLTEKYGAK
jgi:pectinesterase